MNTPIVIIGIGEMGGVFARAFLRSGYPVYPVTRDINAGQVAEAIPEPELALVAVAEADFDSVMDHLPAPWRSRVALLQNELLPRDWESRDLEPTVISAWFEKKEGQDVKVLLPSPVYGPQADLLVKALAAVGIPAQEVRSAEDLLFELLRKNLYILTTNIAGLRVGGTVGELRDAHPGLMRDVARDVLSIQNSLTGGTLALDKLVEAMLEAFAGDPEHRCMGRSAPARLARALKQADEAGLPVPTLRAIRKELDEN
jgi:hypothetical protein